MTDPQAATARPEPDSTGGTVGSLLSELTSEVGTLVRSEVELALAEMKEDLRQAVKAGGMLGGGALSGYFAALFGSFALAWLLDKRMPRWLAFGLVAALHGAVAGALVNRGRQEAQAVDPVPRQTVETLKDSVDMVRPGSR